MEVEPNDAPEPSPIPSPETLFDDSAVDAVPMEAADAQSPADESKVTRQRVDSSDQLPESNGQRTAADKANQQRSSTADSAEREVEASNDGVGSAAAETPGQAVSFEYAFQRAVCMLARGKDEAIDQGGCAVIDDPTVDLCIVVKRAVKAAYDSHGGDICRSPERPDLRLSKEEGQGYLIGSLVVGELLAKEARTVGKRVDYVVSAEEKARQEAAKGAKEKRRAARAVEGDEARATALAAVEAGEAALLAARLRASVAQTLKLPPRTSKVVESKPVSAGVADATAASKLGRLRREAAEAAEALLVADCSRVASKRELERAYAAHSQVCEEMRAVSHAQVWAPLETPQSELDAEWEEWVGMRDVAAANIDGLREVFFEADEAWREAEEAAEAARRAVEAEEAAQAAARQGAELDSMRAARQLERERADAERAEADARLEAVRTALVAGPRPSLAAVFVRSKTPAETCAMLHADAARVWGPQ